MVTDGAPEKASVLSLQASIAPPPVDSATCTAFIVTGPSPSSFDRRRRSWLPPIDENTTWRRVLSPRPGAGGLLPVSVSCGPHAQVPTQLVASPLPTPPPMPPQLTPSPPLEPAVPDPPRSPDDQQEKTPQQAAPTR